MSIMDYPEGNPFGSIEMSNDANIPLKAVSLKGELEGMLFISSIRQEYVNEDKKAAEVIYTFPVAYGTALLGLSATIGGRELTGIVVENAKAVEEYEQAIKEGNTAIMVQKSSVGLYTANLGNIKPGERCEIEIHCARLLDYNQGNIRICVPTVIGERYGDPHASGALAPHESARVDPCANYKFNLSILIKGELARGILDSPTHKIRKEVFNASDIVIELDQQAVLGRDFVLLITPPSGCLSSLYMPEEDKWLACASFCPQIPAQGKKAIALKLVVDCSGSMSGSSIALARAGLGRIIHLLQAEDYISYTRFGSSVIHMLSGLCSCSRHTLRDLGICIEQTQADLGGTQMEEALLSVFRLGGSEDEAPGTVLLITDGDIWNVDGVISAAKKSGHRLFIIGVGAAPAEGLLQKMAQATGGVCEFVTPNESMPEAIVRMFKRMRCAAATDISITWPGNVIWQQSVPSAIYEGDTVHSFALLEEKPEQGAVLKWRMGEESYSEQVKISRLCEQPEFIRLGGMAKLGESRNKAEILEITLKYQLVSDFTSLILVYERDEKLKGLPVVDHVPQMPAYGHGALLCCLKMPPSAGQFFSDQASIFKLNRANFVDQALVFASRVAANFGQSKIRKLGAKVLTKWKKLSMPPASVADFMEPLLAIMPELDKFITKVGDNYSLGREQACALFLLAIIESENLNIERHYRRVLEFPLVGSEEESVAKEEFLEMVA